MGLQVTLISLNPCEGNTEGLALRSAPAKWYRRSKSAFGGNMCIVSHETSAKLSSIEGPCQKAVGRDA